MSDTLTFILIGLGAWTLVSLALGAVWAAINWRRR